MRYIPKTNRCADFDNYLAKSRPSVWNGFNKDVKLKLHQHLLKEQRYLCVYCQQSIPPKLLKDIQPGTIHPSHIEHIRPKEIGQWPHLTFDYTNLGVSCNGFDTNLPAGAHDFCGHPKANAFDDTLFLHPFENQDIEDYFEYDINGKIKPSAKSPAPAQFTIDLLKLDHPTLDYMREQQYLLLIDEEANGLDMADYLDETQPVLPKFISMLKQLFAL